MRKDNSTMKKIMAGKRSADSPVRAALGMVGHVVVVRLRWETLLRSQVENLRYGRLKACATWIGMSVLLLAAVVADTTFAAEGIQDFPYVIQWETGDMEFAPGDSITINSVRGTAPNIITGATYCVEGVYTLASRDDAKVSLFATSNYRGASPIAPEQTMQVSRGSGSFRLVKTMNVDGYLHVSFYPVSSGSSFGGVYFGQGEGVLRNKGWSVTRANTTSASVSSGRTSAGDANRALFEYLGEPVEPPADMDPKYSQEGLSNALRTAVQKAGASLDVQVEDSEFPFLVGVVGVGARSSYAKIMAELKQMGYADQGSVGSPTCQSMNIIPWEAFPREASQRISHRLTVRQQMFFDQLTKGAK